MVSLPGAVLDAVGRSWSCVPVNEEKKPLFPWKTYQDRQPTRDELQSWSERLRPPAWAVVTGLISGVIVLDFEGELR